MKTTKLTPFAAAALFFSSSVYAEEQANYFHAGIVQAYYSAPHISFNNSLVSATFGHKFTESLALEVSAATATNYAAGYLGSTWVTARVDNTYGAYLRAHTMPANGFSVYGKAGFTQGTGYFSASVPGYSASAWSSGSSFSYGAGAQLDVSSNSYVAIDYMSYYSKSGIKVGGPSFNFGFKF